jgi:hypothetical protein
MANGIRSVTPEVPRVSVQDVVQEVSRAQASLRGTPEISMAAGTLSAGQAVSSTLAQADRLSVVRLSPDRDSIIPRLEIPLRTRDSDRTLLGSADRASILSGASTDPHSAIEGFPVAQAGAGAPLAASVDRVSVSVVALVGVLAGAGEVSVTASDGLTGARIGGLFGTHGGTTLIGGTALIGILLGRHTPTTQVTLMARMTIRHRTIRIRPLTTMRTVTT